MFSVADETKEAMHRVHREVPVKLIEIRIQNNTQRKRAYENDVTLLYSKTTTKYRHNFSPERYGRNLLSHLSKIYVFINNKKISKVIIYN